MHSPSMAHELGILGIELPSPPTLPAPTPEKKTQAEPFVISIKPTAEIYSKLEPDWKWREWKKNFKVQAMVRQTDEVLDPN